MNFLSKRLHRLPPYMFGKLKQLTHERRRQGIDVIDLGMGNPNEPTPKHIIDKLCEAAREPRHHRYSISRGIFNLRREVAWHYERRFAVEIDPEHEAIAVIGTKEGLSHLALALIDQATLPSFRTRPSQSTSTVSLLPVEAWSVSRYAKKMSSFPALRR